MNLSIKGGDAMLYFWIAAVIVLLIIEVATMQLVTIWFAVGAAAGLIAYLCNLPLVWQIVLFVAVSALALAVTRPFVKRFAHKEIDPTNADRCIGKTAIVVEDINNNLGKGAVKINGAVWTARSADGEPIETEKEVIIEKIDGVKLIVKKQEVVV
ncbi:MAG: NfeD family protein [Clostridia bacterium]|nr:NfeD family protein [Clostridia bacterium]